MTNIACLSAWIWFDVWSGLAVASGQWTSERHQGHQQSVLEICLFGTEHRQECQIARFWPDCQAEAFREAGFGQATPRHQATDNLVVCTDDGMLRCGLIIYVSVADVSQMQTILCNRAMHVPRSHSEAGLVLPGDSLLERWVIADSQADGRAQLSRSQMQRLDPPSIYKRMVSSSSTSFAHLCRSSWCL